MKKILIPIAIVAVVATSGTTYALTRPEPVEQTVDTSQVIVEPIPVEEPAPEVIETPMAEQKTVETPAQEPEAKKLTVEVTLEKIGATPEEIGCMVDYISWRARGSRDFDVLESYNKSVLMSDYRLWKRNGLVICDKVAGLARLPY